MTDPRSAEDVIAALDLTPHPEGGWYRQTWVAEAPDGERPAGTAIYFLLAEGQASHWHRVDAAEIWLWHAGAPLVLSRAASAEGPATDVILGRDLVYQAVVDPFHWQAARTTGPWSLVSCTVSPGFGFDGFDLAPPGFDIPREVG
ncbi:cupin [Jannaschia pagri]|uniref:Cupin n=1 Tax=Jannaschia pagri TaxID=2829797 RepID=A0ABQ4NP73_9RHOB|nr:MULTISPECIES: cupin domain-containing protein [unclassified Jannaschia]GIT92194.1 cupin [Jannaschia sp. AI_61]GIT96029.1 cupin [Jannaschia sp. AI_62]